MIKIRKIIEVTICLGLFSSSIAWGWGKKGHELISKTATQILVQEDKKGFLKPHDFDLSYYSNVPDIIWRNLGKEVGGKEAPQHFIDWGEVLEKTFSNPDHLPQKFSDYKSKLGKKYKPSLGLSPYRISDVAKRCKELTKDLNREKQGPLLVCLGVLSHYIGDLANPLHCAENHDGQTTGQKGVHAFFETILVGELSFDLPERVQKLAIEKFKNLKASKLGIDENVRRLINESLSDLNTLLANDKKASRDDMKAQLKVQSDLIIDRLAAGTAYVALAWSEILEPVKIWDSERFYFFDGKPDYFQPSY